MSAHHEHGEIVFRDAAPADAGAIAEIERLSFDHAGEQFSLGKIQHLIGSPRAVVIVASEREAILGWACGFAWTRTDAPWGRIFAMALHPSARGRKLAPKMLQHLIDALHGRGAGQMFLEVRVDNGAAIRLYHRFGFEKCRVLHGYYGAGIDAQRMRLL